MNVVYATGSFIVGSTRVDAGTVWPADDPIVKAQPQGFTADPVETPGFRCTVKPRESRGVEQATAAPGERRNTRRAR
jgi:hypothetical protein